MRLSDTIFIRAPPERFFAFFDEMDANYLRWHPDHRLFRWEEGRGLRVGVVFYFEEVFGGKLLKNSSISSRKTMGSACRRRSPCAPGRWAHGCTAGSSMPCGGTCGRRGRM
jgi:hypothetical protein